MIDRAALAMLDGALVKDVVFERGASARAAAIAAGLTDAGVMVVSTPSQRAVAEAAVRELGDRVGHWFDSPEMHVPSATVSEALAINGRLGAGCWLAIGGGSAIGLAKSVALSMDVSVVAVPTTYSGSEMTDIWGITGEEGKKTGRSRRVVPTVVVYDADLTRTLPPAVAGPSGVNAIAHAVEALYAPEAAPDLLALAEAGIAGIAPALRALCGPDRGAGGLDDALDAALLGAALCGIALGRAPMDIHHRLCHLLGGNHNLPHAETHSVILPYAVAHKSGSAPEAMAAIRRALGAESAAAGLRRLALDVGAPGSLREIGGIGEGDLDRIAELATGGPPHPVDARSRDSRERDAVRRLLDDAFHGRDPE